MILDLARFVEKERPHWQALEKLLDGIDAGRVNLGDIKQSQEVLSLFQRACSDLSRVGSANAEPELRTYLETLVGRGYSEIHASHSRSHRFAPAYWLMRTLPRTFRRQGWAFVLSSVVTVVGMIVGGILLQLPYGKEIAMAPFAHVAHSTPSQRVANEEKMMKSKEGRGAMEDGHATFAGHLMQNNATVTIKAMALGLTYGVMTAVVLFYNGVILGAVALDYMLDGQTVFLLGWLLPHGSFEIPAILIGGQAGFVLARALIGWGTREGLRARLRVITPDLATLIGGAALMLIWAGFVESFLSQYHEPAVPYGVKIAFGLIELGAVVAFYGWCGRPSDEAES